MIGRGYQRPPSPPSRPQSRPRVDWRNSRLADFVQFNATPGNFLNAAVTDNMGSAGWSIPLLGGVGKSVSDPFDGWHAISATPIRDVFGVAIVQTQEWATWLGLHEVSGVTASADIDIVVGLCNGPTDGATLDWAGFGFRLGANRTCLTTIGIDGGASTATGTASAAIRRVQAPLVKVGTVTSSMMRPFVRYLDGNNAAQAALTAGASTAANSEAGGDRGWADAPAHIFVAAYRVTTTDTTTRTPCYQPAHAPPVSLPLP